MTAFTFLLVLIATYHYLYEGVVAPTIRMHLRNKLFTLRDELRLAMIDGVAPENHEAFWLVHKGINFFLDSLPSYTISTLRALESIRREDKHVGEMVQERMAIINKCSDPRIRDVHTASAKLLRATFLVNSGGWFVTVVPLALTVACFRSMVRFASAILVVPETEAKAMRPA